MNGDVVCQACGYDEKSHDYVNHVLGACANFMGEMMSEDKEYTPPAQQLLHIKYAAEEYVDKHGIQYSGGIVERSFKAGALWAEQKAVSCPCTLIEQDEDCPIGYPSMICGICEGNGHTTQEQVTALACEMIKIASDVGEPEDPFAAWESIELLKSQAAPQTVVDVEDIREQKLATIVAPDNGTPKEVLAAVLECATAWVPDARIIGNVRAGDIARAARAAIAYAERLEVDNPSKP